jgi:hypothetical protein
MSNFESENRIQLDSCNSNLRIHKTSCNDNDKRGCVKVLNTEAYNTNEVSICITEEVD